MPNSEPIVHLVTDNEAKHQAKEIFKKIEKTTGTVPRRMRVMANCEDTFAGFFMLFNSLMDDKPTNKLLKRKIAFVVSEINKCEFCVSVSKIQLKNLWLDKKGIATIQTVCNDSECIALEYAKATATHAYNIDPKLIKQLKANFSDAQIVEITSVIGLFSYINRFNDALQILPEM